MRIQHNIMAMNAYRNLGKNNSSLSKNLEKLSSGYRINRAGDDAAGLAISEKMRAQIAGLDQAQKNAQSGINLVQTAEGALTEVHDMLNRMVTLSTQAANGTYTETDAKKLQAEVKALTSEIDRIADNSNFNGKKLLNGELSGPAVTVTKGVQGNAATSGTKGTFTIAQPSQVTTTNASNEFDVTVGGKTFSVASNNTSAASQAAAWAAAWNVANGSGNFTATATGSNIVFEQKVAGTGTQKEIGLTGLAVGTTGEAAKTLATGSGTTTEIDFTGLTGEEVLGGTITVGTVKYEFIDADDADAAASGTNTAVKVSKNATATDIANALKAELDKDTAGVSASNTASSAGGKITITEDKPVASSIYSDAVAEGVEVESEGLGSLVLQIGADAVETIGVSIDSMKAASLKLDTIDITTNLGANEAIKTINDAIEKVSVQRGNLGAIQNRLEHTINNLGVMEENIQDAEANIRDTDIADEMMAYTKNNILIQSAQAMLAQANQVPQGVLQLMG